jgi:hypothetical protein
VYGLRTRTWSEWKSDKNTLHYFGPISTVHLASGNEYYAGSCVNGVTTAVKLLDKTDSINTEQSFNTTATVTDTYTRTVSNGLGTADTGQTYTNTGGAASDYSVDGSKGNHSLTSAAVARVSSINGVSFANFDVTHTFSTNKLAAGNNQVYEFYARFTSFNNTLFIRVEFTPTQTVIYTIFKVVAGVTTSLATGTIGGLVHAINKEFSIRFRGMGSILQAKIWETLSGQPAGWNFSVSDSSIVSSGTFQILTNLFAGNTNATLTFKFDDLSITNINLVTSSISCSVRTKNFDMATSHQFKRMWWWGVDCITNNSVTGVATPITSSFVVTWDDLANYTWDQLNTWDQPLTAPTLVQTVQSTGMGTVRQFIKFLKALRYRQINFSVVLTTVGDTSDGPAKIFSMTVATRPAQVVSKAVS